MIDDKSAHLTEILIQQVANVADMFAIDPDKLERDVAFFYRSTVDTGRGREAIHDAIMDAIEMVPMIAEATTRAMIVEDLVATGIAKDEYEAEAMVVEMDKDIDS